MQNLFYNQDITVDANELLERALFWEDYVTKYPKSQFIKEAQYLYQVYSQLLFKGVSVNPVSQSYLGESSVKSDHLSAIEKLSKLKAKINNYKEYGLMPQIDILEEYPEHLQNVLSLYIDDMEQKMSSFDKFYKQLSLFDRFVSGKVLSNKKIKLNLRR